MTFRIFVVILALSPIPFGSDRPWAWSLYALVIACFGLLYFGKILFSRQSVNIAIKPLKYPICLVMIPVIWSIVQISPWVPATWVHPFWALAAQQLQQTVNPYISLAPTETLSALLKLISYCMVFFLSYQYNRQADMARYTFNSIAYFGFAYALYGLIVFFGDFHTILWFKNTEYKNDLVATFINRNSYATYAGLGLLACFPLLLKSLNASLLYGLTSHFGKQYFIEQFFHKVCLPIMMVITLFTALFLTHSRGGFFSTLLAVIIFFGLSFLTGKMKTGKTALFLLLGLVGVVILFGFWNSGDELVDRFGRVNADKQGREAVYQILHKAILENAWLGTGYGSFEYSFRLYRDEQVDSFYDLAHNTYLENMFELGVVPALALFAAIANLAVQCLKGVWIRQRDWSFAALGFAMTVLVGTHALVDFSLQIPAVAYTYALLIGAACAQAQPRQYRLASGT